jgi:type IV secretion system protein VirD4
VEPQDRLRLDLDTRARRRIAELDQRAREAQRRITDTADRARRAAAAPSRPTVAPGATTPPGSQNWGGVGGQDIEDKLLVWAVPAAGVALLPLAAGHLAAMLAHGSWPRYRLTDVPGIFGRLLDSPGDPGRAWEPVNTGAAVPGPVLWWGSLAFIAAMVGLVGLLIWAASRPAPRMSPPSAASSWADRRQERELWAHKDDPHRLVLGVADGHRLAVRDRHSVLVVGPAHTGKTSGVSVPAIVEWEGPVMVASTKGHLIDETIGWRSQQGEVHVYDPAAITRYYRSGWSVLAECDTWEGAIRTASDLTLAARAAVGATDAGDGITAKDRGDIWRSSMAMSLAPFLYAAVSSGRSIGTAAEWIEREERDEVLEVLDNVDRTAARAHRSTFMRADPSRSTFLHAMHEILSVYEDPVVAASLSRHEIVPDELLDGHNSLYLTAPEYDQDRFRPLCAMVVRRVLATAYEISARRGGPLDPPLLVVLDDVTGIAPIYDLAALASTAAARGVQLVSVAQDAAQLDEQYGDAAAMVIKNHGARLLLPGGPGSAGGIDQRLATGASLEELRPDESALLYGTRSPIRLRLRPWFRDRELQRRVETPQDALRPAERVDSSVPMSVAEQSALWLQRITGRTAPDVDDPTIPLDTSSRGFTDVFGSLEDETMPSNVRRLRDVHRPDR